MGGLVSVVWEGVNAVGRWLGGVELYILDGYVKGVQT